MINFSIKYLYIKSMILMEVFIYEKFKYISRITFCTRYLHAGHVSSCIHSGKPFYGPKGKPALIRAPQPASKAPQTAAQLIGGRHPTEDQDLATAIKASLTSVQPLSDDLPLPRTLQVLDQPASFIARQLNRVQTNVDLDPLPMHWLFKTLSI